MQRSQPWWIVVPMKDTRNAKTRFGGSRSERRQLAIVMARDTLCAVVNAARVQGVLVVCDRPEDVESFSLPGVTVQTAKGQELNAAIQLGVAAVRATHREANVASLPGDLPYLRSTELDRALAKADRVTRSCVSDHSGEGTTLLTATAGHDLSPAYGPNSFQAHQALGAVELDLPAWSGLRRDVDCGSDLIAEASLGYRTKELVQRRREATLVKVGA